MRYMCGVFWRTKEDSETCFKQLRACEDGLFFQAFWTEEPQGGFDDDEVAAIVAHFDMVPENTKYIAVYPAYFVALGPSVVKRCFMCQHPNRMASSSRAGATWRRASALCPMYRSCGEARALHVWRLLACE